jgi:hypothetical protein
LKNVITTVKEEGTKKGAHWVWDCNKAPPGTYEDTMTPQEKAEIEKRKEKEEKDGRRRRGSSWGDEEGRGGGGGGKGSKGWGEEKKGIMNK